MPSSGWCTGGDPTGSPGGRTGRFRHRYARPALGPDGPVHGHPARRPRRPLPPHRGGRLRRRVDERDGGPRRLHAARARRRAHRAAAARDRRRQPVHARAGACSRSTARRSRTRRGGRFVLGLGSSSNVIVERWNGVPFEKPLCADARGDRGAAAGARGRARAGRVQARDAAGGARADRRGGAARQDARPRRASSATARSRTSCRCAGRARSPRRSARPTRSSSAASSASPTPAEEALPAARRMLVAYATVPVYAAFFRWLGWGERIDPMVDGLGGRRPQARARARPRRPRPRGLRVRRRRTRSASACGRSPTTGSRRSCCRRYASRRGCCGSWRRWRRASGVPREVCRVAHSLADSRSEERVSRRVRALRRALWVTRRTLCRS